MISSVFTDSYKFVIKDDEVFNVQLVLRRKPIKRQSLERLTKSIIRSLSGLIKRRQKKYW